MIKKKQKVTVELAFQNQLVSVVDEKLKPISELEKTKVENQPVFLLEVEDVNNQKLLEKDFEIKKWKQDMGTSPSASTIENWKNLCQKVSEFKYAEEVINSVKRQINASMHPLFPSRNYAWILGETFSRISYNESQSKWLLIAIKSLINYGAIHQKLKYVLVDVDMSVKDTEESQPEQMVFGE